MIRDRLDDLLERNDVDPAARERMRSAFDDHARLVESPAIQRTGGLPLPGAALVPPDPDDEPPPP